MPKKRSRLKDKRILFAALVGGLILVVALLEITNTTHFFHTEKVPAVISTSSLSEGKQDSSPASNSQANNQITDSSKAASSTGGQPSSDLRLVAPYGDFVSNHHPGDNSPLDEVSVCDTTPGAICYIKFSNGKITTQLPPQTVGSDGSTTWSWNAGKDAHLSSGEWQITAVASLNNQTKSTDDPIKLVIK